MKNFIISLLKEYNYFDKNGTLKGKIAYDVGYDMKPDFENSEYNTAKKINDEEWEQAWDEIFDLILEDEIIPILVKLGAEIEE